MAGRAAGVRLGGPRSVLPRESHRCPDQLRWLQVKGGRYPTPVSDPEALAYETLALEDGPCASKSIIEYSVSPSLGE
jgi:hypothetical protein